MLPKCISSSFDNQVEVLIKFFKTAEGLNKIYFFCYFKAKTCFMQKMFNHHLSHYKIFMIPIKIFHQ